MDLRAFAKALLCKLLWRGIFGEGPWSVTVKLKYMKGKYLEYWYRSGAIGSKHKSAIWLSFRKVEKHFIKNLKWRIHTDSSILIGFDPIACSRGNISIPENLLYFLHRNGNFTWDKLISAWRGLVPLWKDAIDLVLLEELNSSWKSVKDALGGCGIQRCGTTDHLIWTVPNAQLPARVKDIYSDIISSKFMHTSSKFLMVLWKSRCPFKMIFFVWLVFNNKNLTWDNLRKRSWHGPSRCSMCESDEESNFHMLFQCKSSQQIWYDLAILFGFPHVAFVSIHAAFEWWCRQREPRRILIIIVLWCAGSGGLLKSSETQRNPISPFCNILLQSTIQFQKSSPKERGLLYESGFWSMEVMEEEKSCSFLEFVSFFPELDVYIMQYGCPIYTILFVIINSC